MTLGPYKAPATGITGAKKGPGRGFDIQAKTASRPLTQLSTPVKLQHPKKTSTHQETLPQPEMRLERYKLVHKSAGHWDSGWRYDALRVSYNEGISVYIHGKHIPQTNQGPHKCRENAVQLPRELHVPRPESRDQDDRHEASTMTKERPANGI